uniref:Aquaporin 1 n=1 Tax=Steinernema monticolum TaxID=90984 RepID=A0AAU6SI65_9BILA
MTGKTEPSEVLRNKIRIKNPLIRNLLAEFLGTLMLLFFGTSIVAQFILSGEKLNTWIQINVGWGFAIAFCVYATAKTSGGHLNPAISLAMVTLGRLPLVHFFLYTIVQTLGALIGSGLMYAVYYEAIQANSNITDKEKIMLFTSYPRDYVTWTGAFVDQAVGTGFLAFFVCVVIDKRNKIPDVVHPLFFGFILMTIGMAFGINLGYPINPARDFGPRILASMIVSKEAFTILNGYYWIAPAFAPFFGAVSAVWFYHVGFGAHLPDPEEERLILPIKDESALPLKQFEQ